MLQDKAVYADNAHKLFHSGNVGDHIALMTVFNSWEESGFATQWCYENYVQARPSLALSPLLTTRHALMLPKVYVG